MAPFFHPYDLPLQSPVVLKGVAHHHRKGVLILLRDGLENEGHGDICPLPGFSRETLEEAIEQVDDLRGWLEGLEPQAGWARLDHPFHAAVDAMDLHPSVRFGIELALFDLIARAEERSLPSLMHPDPAVTVPLNALLVGDDEAALLKRAEVLVDQGYRTLKLKVGRKPIEDDVRRVRALRFAVGPDVALRLDANRAWTMHEALDFAEGIAGFDIAYVEEPLQNPRDLPLLWYDGGLPIALDETLAELAPEELAGRGWGCATAAVLKPTILGGIIPTLRMASAARDIGITPVISGAFESGVAMRANVALAAATGGAPAGLDPYNFLAEDILEPRLPLDRPVVDVPSLFSRPLRILP